MTNESFQKVHLLRGSTYHLLIPGRISALCGRTPSPWDHWRTEKIENLRCCSFCLEVAEGDK